MNKIQKILLIIFCIYISWILTVTILPSFDIFIDANDNLLHLMIEFNVRPKKSINITPFISIISYINGTAVNQLDNSVKLEMSILNVIGNIIIFIPIGTLAKCNIKSKVLSIAFPLLLSFFIEFIQFFEGRSADIDDISFCIYLFIYFLLLKPYSVSISDFDKSYLIILSVESIIIIIVTNVIWNDISQNNFMHSIYYFYIILLFLLVYEYISTFHMGIKNIYLHRQNNEINNLIKIQDAQYDYQREKENNIRKMRHDLRNHIAVVQDFLANGKYSEAKNYITTLSNNFENNTYDIHVGNDLLDALLNFYHHLAVENGITISVHGCLQDSPNISDVDFCTIIGNILRNAYEATALCEEKTIDLTIRQNSNQIFIEESNPFIGTLNIHNGQLYSTKTKNLHDGIGMSNIKDTIIKNHGSVQYSTIKKNGTNYFNIICAFEIK